MIHFSTREFEASHAKAPRGYGQWGFFFGDSDEPRFVPYSMSYTAAKKWIRIQAAAEGVTSVRVAP